MSAETVTIRMNRLDLGTPWGFRLQGGKEFGAPLTVGRITGGSVADKAGLREGDYLVQLFGQQADSLKHKEAQEAIIGSGNNLDVVIERGAVRIWAPSIRAVDIAPGDTNSAPVKISLAHDHKEVQPIPGHNVPAKPFGNPNPITATSNSTITSDLQYNSPSNLYSKSSAAEAYLQQTGGLFGTDPKLTQEKPEPIYMKSATLKLIHETEKSSSNQGYTTNILNETSSNTQYDRFDPMEFQSKSFKALSQIFDEGSPVSKPEAPKNVPFTPGPPPPGAPICDICGRAIISVFCKAGEKNLHPDCFNCATCGTNLKNKGYFLIHDKLYCEIHAKQQNENQFKATPPVDPNIFAGRAPPPPMPTKIADPIKAFYQPEIMKRGAVVNAPKASNLSPQSRGVPTHLTDQYRSNYSNITLTSSDYSLRGSSPSMPSNLPPSTAPFTSPHHNLNIAPLASTRTGKFHWPPKPGTQQSSLVGHTWNVPEDLTSGPRPYVGQDYERLITYNIGQYAKLREKQTPSPQRHLLTEDVGRQQEWKKERQEIELENVEGLEKMFNRKFDNLNDFTETFEHMVIPPRITTSISFEQSAPKLAGKNFFNGNEHNWTSLSKPPSSSLPTNGVSSNTTADSSMTTSILKTARKPILKKENKSKDSILDASSMEVASSASGGNNLSQDFSMSDRPDSLSIQLEHTSNVESLDQHDESSQPPWRNPASRPGGAISPNVPSGGQSAGASAPKRGRGILKQLFEAPRIPMCESCQREIRGPFVLAMGKTWCPDHFVCTTNTCHRKLLDVGFVEENNQIYCEYCFEKYFAPLCTKCSRPVTGDCLTAMQHQWHPECFMCVQCHKPFGNSSFFVENGQPICENDWNTSYTTKCVNCKFSIEAGDRWVEALGNPYHSDCFTCTVCQKNLEGQSFYAKGNKPYCKAHA